MQIADGVLVLDAVEPAHGHLARIAFAAAIGPRRRSPAGPGGRRRSPARVGRGLLLRRHFARVHHVLHAVPDLAILDHGLLILVKMKGDARLFLVGAVAVVAVLLQEGHEDLGELLAGLRLDRLLLLGVQRVAAGKDAKGKGNGKDTSIAAWGVHFGSFRGGGVTYSANILGELGCLNRVYAKLKGNAIMKWRKWREGVWQLYRGRTSKF